MVCCQINLKLLLIVGVVCLMMIITCRVSSFSCRDRRKKASKENILVMCRVLTISYYNLVPYGVSMAHLPPNVWQYSLMMDPTRPVKATVPRR